MKFKNNHQHKYEIGNKILIKYLSGTIPGRITGYGATFVGGTAYYEVITSNGRDYLEQGLMILIDYEPNNLLRMLL